MRQFALYFGIAIALVTSCSVHEKNIESPHLVDEIFYASFEQPAEIGTRVYANESLFLRWTAEDRVSIFNNITHNQEYRFTGETGDDSGGFRKVNSDEFVSGNSIPHIVSVYPYKESTKITENEVLTITLPSEQHYGENTFGLGDNTMVSVSSDNVLQYKNIGGYLRLSLYGEGISVSSIVLKGNNGEKLAGNASITMPLNGVPSVNLANNATDEITLTCDSPVELGSTADNATDFWFVVPPTSFSKGFTITVSIASGGVIEKSTSKSITLERNLLSKMSPIEIKPALRYNKIYYTTTDNKALSPYSVNFSSELISNEYVNGSGVLTFSQDLTYIGCYAFYGCKTLSSIILPESVTTIEHCVFDECSNLSGVTMPDGVTFIGNYAFYGCTGLSSLSLPLGLKTIDYCAFYNCPNLTSITIPAGVTSIGEAAFYGCKQLSYITVLAKTPPTGDRLMFDDTNECPIYVPAESINTYISTLHWKDYSDRILPLSAVHVESVSLDKTSIELAVGNTTILKATVLPNNATDKTVIWSSGNPSVATVSSSGIVTAKAAGSTTITVTTNDGGKKATCSVRVTSSTVSVTGVSLNKTSLSLTEGETQTLVATVSPSNATDKSVTWTSSNTTVATVSSSGIVTAKKAGTATITVTSNDGGKKATCSVTVSAQVIHVTGVSLNYTSLTMTEGGTKTLVATVTPSNATDKSVTWSSSNTNVATVSSSGIVTAKAAGTTKITVTTNDGRKTATCSVTVVAATIPVTGVSLSQTSLMMRVGETQTLTAIVSPSDATDKSVNWSSSNSSVATVSSSGMITAISVGETLVSAKCGDLTASCEVTVIDSSIPYIMANDQSVPAIADRFSFSVQSNTSWKVVVPSGLTLLSSQICENDATVTIAIKPNWKQKTNTFTISLTPTNSSYAGISKTITITQKKVAKWIACSVFDLKNDDIFLFGRKGETTATVASEYSGGSNVAFTGIEVSTKANLSGDEIVSFDYYDEFDSPLLYPLQVEVNGDEYRFKAVTGMYQGKYLHAGGLLYLDFISGSIPEWTTWTIYQSTAIGMSPGAQWYTFGQYCGSHFYIMCFSDSYKSLYTATTTAFSGYCHVFRQVDDY